ncbi:putative defensin-like protein 184 [Tripterygium wilfordii]|uniref:putative defensin-like protein 184 n=1 Tax=Tripterygium wilfordii TaxID=458696 RepID=UPI0018F85BEE|nr:putative defensin-like protein 184 [Tripterygium wilfordii]
MATLCSFMIFFIVLVLSVDKTIVQRIEAKECIESWKCTSQTPCVEDCKNKKNGTGGCLLIPPPGFPLQCYCTFQCAGIPPPRGKICRITWNCDNKLEHCENACKAFEFGGIGVCTRYPPTSFPTMCYCKYPC